MEPTTVGAFVGALIMGGVTTFTSWVGSRKGGRQGGQQGAEQGANGTVLKLSADVAEIKVAVQEIQPLKERVGEMRSRLALVERLFVSAAAASDSGAE